MPFRFEAATLSRIRSPVISRSNWAKDSSMLRVSRPMRVVVLKAWVDGLSEPDKIGREIVVQTPWAKAFTVSAGIPFAFAGVAGWAVCRELMRVAAKLQHVASLCLISARWSKGARAA